MRLNTPDAIIFALLFCGIVIKMKVLVSEGKFFGEVGERLKPSASWRINCRAGGFISLE